MAARVLRVVFRLDYDEVNYDFLDRQGSALRILKSVPDHFWDRVGDGRMPRSFGAQFTSESVFRNLNANPMSLDGSIESRSGIPLRGVPDNKEFRIITGIVDKLCHESKITTLSRCGLRLYCLESLRDNYTDQFERFSALASSDLASNIEASLGDIADVAVSYEGKAPDGISYRARFGPFVEGDLGKLLRQLSPSFEDEPFYKKAHLSMDLDFFEHNLSFRELNIQRWSRTHWEKAESVLGHLRSLMLSREG